VTEHDPESHIANSLVPFTKQQARVLLEAGYLWLDMQQFDKAKDVFAGAAALMPKSEVPQLGLGTLHFAQGQHDKALQAYRSAQKLAPNPGLARAHVGEVLLFMGKVNEAMKELKAAIEVDDDGDGGKLARALIEAKDAGALPPKGR
jgi:tetratricopeptide (TPR) repeat protein